MSAVWYYRRDDKTEGPVYREDVEHLLRLGMLGRDDLVWRNGMDEWTAAKELFDANLPAPPQPPPPPIPKQTAPVPHSPTPSTSTFRRRRSNNTAAIWICICSLTIVSLVGGGWLLSSMSQPTDSDEVTKQRPVAKNPAGRKKNRKASTPRKKASRGSARSTPKRHPGSFKRKIAPPTRNSSDNQFVEPIKRTVAPSVVPTGKARGAQNDNVPTEKQSDPKPVAKKVKKRSRVADDRPIRRKELKLYQDLLIQRKPSFNVNGIAMNQRLQYRILSQLDLGPMDADRQFTVRQKVLEAKLDHADPLSRATFATSLSNLVGQEFTFKMNRQHMVVKFTGHKNNRKSIRVQPGAKKDGFLVTSVMDEDGWKEMAQLSFFVPEKDTKRGRWSREMSHDWGSLGRWTGSTIFQPAEKKGLIQAFNYIHKMKYSASKGKNKRPLPFPISSPSFSSDRASGTVLYDTENYRVHSAEETFHARGSFRTQVLGQAAQIRMEEEQKIQLRLTEEKPSWGS